MTNKKKLDEKKFTRRRKRKKVVFIFRFLGNRKKVNNERACKTNGKLIEITTKKKPSTF